MKDFDYKKFEEFDNHKLVQSMVDEKIGFRGFIAIHRDGNNASSLGATRLWRYQIETNALRDALRLSKTMSYKAALAGFPYGGAKAALIFSPKIKKCRKQFIIAYTKYLNSLKGRFVTGTDVGITNRDIKFMRKHTPYVIGSKVDPAYYTAVGVYLGIKESLKQIFGSEDIKDRSFIVQGAGKTGFHLLKLIYPSAAKIFISEIDKKIIKKAKHYFPKIKIISPEEIIKQKIDVFCPCAVGGAINLKNAVNLRCKIVAGSANNQLEGQYVDSLLYKSGILYAPDYAINAGGLISVVDEMEHGKPDKKRILQRLNGIPAVLKIIFDRSEKEKRPTGAIAGEIAEKTFNKNA